MRFIPTLVISAALAALPTAAPASPAFGEPDASFVSPALAPANCQRAFTVLGDQGVLVTFQPEANGSVFDGAIARLRSDGALDTRWGDGGIATWRDLSRYTGPTAIHRLADGGFLVAGHAALRFRADGSLDTSYGDNGQSELFSGSFRPAEVVSTAVQPDGSVVALMNAFAFFGPAITLTRMGPNGRRDRTFGNNGVVLTALDYTVVRPYAWGVQADGRVQIATVPGRWQGALAAELHRYPNDFTLTDVAAGRLMPRDVVALWTDPGARVDAQGRVYIATSCEGEACGGKGLVVARFDGDGRPDASFGTGGYALASTAAMNSTSFPQALNLGADGTVTVIVSSPESSGLGLRAYRFTQTGELDERFANGQALASSASAVAFDEAGRVLVTSGASCQVQRLLGDQARSDAVMVEYRYRDRYFITAEGFESAILDDDPATEKLRRTGRTFGAWQPAAQQPGALPLCRFSGDPVAGPVGHFYALQGPECDLVRADDDRLPAGVRTWRFEGFRFNEAAPSPAGSCPSSLQPVYRLYNDAARRGGDPNHRFVTDPSGIAEMQAQGWISEGTMFCAPPLQAIR